MPYLIKAHDLPDALPRRMQVREQHLAALASYKEAGKVLYAAALLNDKGELAGSLMALDMTRSEIQELLAAEPYIANNVWDVDSLEIIEIKPAPGFAK